MKALTLLTLTLAAMVWAMVGSKPAILDQMCGYYWQTDNPKIYWPVCDPWWTARPGEYGDD